ncbi:hypothetical protein R50345_05950 [Paenibacillus sp. FSL R5-0345]|uniref:hypothetical protein n=1 Tax=Paenibacillus sp. FSL R5-0345 TaxID=1536770 RepID=UPI0004F8AFE6|nr:hypothetical protein [Paenibacillus sp. FSL R5-0345]AIQ34208.1 hypothetical protein R50345_05950 [Paenibacillus sp. FSL R5-0345]
MTPERIEEIKQTAKQMGLIPALMASDLLAALEESQQQNKRLEVKLQASRDSVYPISVERDEYKVELAEAQQTIARQQKVIDWYESGGSMGELVEEGSDKAPQSTREGGECTCVDCGGLNSSTWVCKQCQDKRDQRYREGKS